MATLVDFGAFFILVVIVCTGVRFLPLCKDLARTGSFNIFSDRNKIILHRHLSRISYDLFYLIRFIVCSIFIFIFVGGIPRFLIDLPLHLSSMQDASNCAARHCSEVLYFIWEIFTLVFAFRTYRLAIKVLIVHGNTM